MCLLSFKIYSQKIKVDKFELISYEFDPYNNIKIDSYTSIDRSGKLNVYIDRILQRDYYSYQLTNSEIKTINKLFNDNLTSFIDKKLVESNIKSYEEGRKYISYSINNQKKSLCFINFLMNSRFTDIIKLLNKKIYAYENSAKVSYFKIEFSRLEKEIAIQNKIDNYLPEIALPAPSP